MLISTALLLDSNIRNSVCTPAKLPCRRVEVGYEKDNIFFVFYYRCDSHATKDFTRFHWIIHDHVIHELYCRGKTWVIAGNICSRWNEH
jgi:hypothetical protein